MHRGVDRLNRPVDCRARLRRPHHRIGVRRLGQRPAAGREGLQGRRGRGRCPLRGRGLRGDLVRPEEVPVPPRDRLLRHPAHRRRPGLADPGRRWCRRRVAGLREHALRAAGGVLQGRPVARHHRLEGRAGAVLRPGEADARRGREPTAHAVRRRHGEGRQRPRRGRHLPPDPGRRLLRRTRLPARRARGRPVLRRRRPGPRHLHRVRQLHDRLQVQRQEHPDEELPLPRRAARREGDGAEHRHARRAGCGRRLRRHHQVHQGEASARPGPPGRSRPSRSSSPPPPSAPRSCCTG